MALTSVQSFHSPDSSEAVVKLLEQYEDSALIVAGGTFLHGLVSRGLLTGIEALINIQKLGLNKINASKDKIDIGATTIFAQLADDKAVQTEAWLGAVKDAIGYPPVQIMNSATIGGSIASSCPFFDLPVSFLALNGSVTACGGSGEREIAMQDFFAGLFENSLEANEFLAGISIPKPSGKATSAFVKMETNANDLAILNVAAMLNLDDKGNCADSRVFIGGGVGETPVRGTSAEAVLNGASLSDDTFGKAGDAVLKDVDPLSDHRASSEYRKAMSKVMLQRALQKAAERIA